MRIDWHWLKRVAVKFANVAFCVAVASILLSVGAQQLCGRSWGWCMVSGESMSPTVASGDFVFIAPYFVGESSPPGVGDVIAYEDTQGHRTIHRVVDITGGGYITQGDNNPIPDQETGQSVLPPGKVDGTALAVGGQLVSIPVVGAVALELLDLGLRLPLIIVSLGVAVALLITGRRAKRPVRRRKRFGLQGFCQAHKTFVKYSILTMIGAVVLMSAMVRISSTTDLRYGVSRQPNTPLVTSGGVNLGTLQAGSKLSHDLRVSSNFPIRMTALLIEHGDSLSLSENPLVLPAKGEAVTTLVVHGTRENMGVQAAHLTMLVFPSVIPGWPVYELARYHHLLGILAVSLVCMLAVSVPAGFLEHVLARGERTTRAIRIATRKRKQ